MLGIFLAEKVVIPPILLYSFLFFSFLSILYFTKGLKSYTQRWMAGLPVFVFMLMVGFWLTYDQNELRNPLHFQKSIQTENYIIGTIATIPIIKNNKVKIELTTEAVGKNKNQVVSCQGKLLLYLNNYSDAPILQYGDRICFKSQIQPIPRPTNPNAFDYSRYLYFKNIHFQAYVRDQNWKVLARKQGNPFWQRINACRKHYLQVLEKYIQTDKEVAIAAALILGYKANLTPELKSTYSETGAIHVLAVSGLHVGIISAILLMLLNLFPFKGVTWNWLKFIFLIVGIWGFALLTGLPPSIKRAAIMFTCLHIGLIIQRPINRYNTIAIAAFFILLTNPYALFDVGFQFSFLAVIGIFFFAKRILRIWSPKSRWWFEIWNLIVVSCSAQLILLPLILYYFHQMPTYFWLSSLLVIPLAGVLMNLGLTILLFHHVHEALAKYMGELITWLIYAQNYLIDAIQHLPLHLMNGFWLSELEVVLFYGIILGIAMLLLTYNARWIIMALTCLLVISCVQVGTKFKQIQQPQIIIYDIPKKSGMDFVDGTTTYTLTDSTLTENDYRYHIQNNRWATRMEEIIPLKPGEIETAHLFKKDNLYQFYDLKLAVINQALPTRRMVKNRLTIDYLILQGNPEISILDLLNYYDFETIIFDSSNTSWNIRNWIESCEQLAIPYQNIPQNGAFIIEVKKH